MSTQNAQKLDTALLLLRIVVGLVFVTAGWGKVTGIEGAQELFSNVGIPFANVTAWIVALIELIGGAMVLVGYKIRIPAALLALIMVGAIVFVKLSQGWGPMRIDLALLAMSVSLYLVGSGSYSLGGGAASGEGRTDL
ncbi:MAG: DoxX family protein [Balneolaceae bacterium]